MPIAVGTKAPDFNLKSKTAAGVADVKLSNNFGKKNTVILFFPLAFTGVCTTEMCDITAGLGQYSSLNADVIGVSVDKNEKLYRRFLDQFPVTFQIARDPSWDIAASFGTFQLPETYVIDRSGRVVQKVIAAQNWMNPEFVQDIKKLL